MSSRSNRTTCWSPRRNEPVGDMEWFVWQWVLSHVWPSVSDNTTGRQLLVFLTLGHSFPLEQRRLVPWHQEVTSMRVGHHGVMNPLETWSDLSDSGYGVTRDHLYQTIQQVDNFLFFSLLLILSLFNKDALVPCHQEATLSCVGHHGVMHLLETWSDWFDSGYVVPVTHDHLYQTIQGRQLLGFSLYHSFFCFWTKTFWSHVTR